MKPFLIFLLVCALVAGGTLFARHLRLEREKMALYAAALAECANGRSFNVARTIVFCNVVQVAD